MYNSTKLERGITVAKKRKKNMVTDILRATVLLLGVLASILLLLKSFKIELGILGDLELEGLKVAFGDSDKVKGNFLVALAIILPTAAGVLGFVLNNKIGNITAVLVNVVAIVLLLTLKVPLISNVSADLKLTVTGYISLVLTIINTLVSSYRLTLDLK